MLSPEHTRILLFIDLVSCRGFKFSEAAQAYRNDPDSDPKKLRTLERIYRQTGGAGFINNTYSFDDKGRLKPQIPTHALNLEWVEPLESGSVFARHDILAVEPLFMLDHIGMKDLALEILEARTTAATFAGAALGFDSPDESKMVKEAFYSVLFSRNDVPVNAGIRTAILEKWPRLTDCSGKPQSIARFAKTAKMGTDFNLNLALFAEDLPKCEVSGFWHYEPLIAVPLKEEWKVSQALTAFGYSFLRDMLKGTP